MKRFVLALCVLCATLFTFNSCGITWMDGYDEYVEYTYYDYMGGTPIIYKGTVPYYVIWNDGYTYMRVPYNRYVYIRQYPEVHYYYRPYSSNYQNFYNRDMYPGGTYFDYYDRYYYAQPTYVVPRTPRRYSDYNYRPNNSVFGISRQGTNNNVVVQPSYQQPQQNQSFGNMRRENMQNSPVNNNPPSSTQQQTYNSKFGGHR